MSLLSKFIGKMRAAMPKKKKLPEFRRVSSEEVGEAPMGSSYKDSASETFPVFVN